MSSENTTIKKIMFVDDDAFILDMYSLKFSKANYEVKAVDSADNALKMIRDGYTPDVMLVDIAMQGMNGLEFVGSLRKERLATGSVIIMLTNNGAPEDVAQAKKLNVDGYIVKATTIPSEVLGEVEKICASKKS